MHMRSTNGIELAQLLLNEILLMTSGWPTADTVDDPLTAQHCPKEALPIALSWPSFYVHVLRRWHRIGPAPIE
jgi:hypothetical protein